jgi:phosphoserine phosphatase RsbU/P
VTLLRNLSLKFKLVLLLILLTGTMLSLYAFMALRDFERDKIAYVLDSSLEQTRSAARQVRTEMGYLVERTQFLLRGYDLDTKKFHAYTATLFPQEHRFVALFSYQLSAAGGEYEFADMLKKDNLSADDIKSLQVVATQMLKATDEAEITLARPQSAAYWLLGVKYQTKGKTPIVVIAALERSDFMALFDSPQMQDMYLIDNHYRLVLSPTQKIYDASTDVAHNSFVEATAKINSPEGVYQYRESENVMWLVALADVGLGHLKVASMIPRSAALETVRLVMIKSAIFLVLLFFVTVILSVLSSMTLTASLKKLIGAAADIARGNFNVKVPIRGTDEIGTLALGFNQMAGEIQRLIGETAEKARMKNELETAQIVQSTLFPADYFQDENIEICGHYEPASECSGDWWYYHRVGDKTMFCIGDATGHGVSAALLTAAARSAASALEIFPELPLNEMMNVFNSSIYNTSKGRVMMTFFLGCYDRTTGVVTYTNASHEAPLVLPGRPDIQKRDIISLMESTGPRLGENANSVYTMSRVELAPGDRIILYTDGVTELKNSEGGMWGERAFLKSILHSANSNETLPVAIESLSKELKAFRKEAPLADDVTYFMVARQKAA